MRSLRHDILQTFREYGFKANTTWEKTNTRIYGKRIYYLGFPGKEQKLKGLAILKQEDFGVVDYDEKGVLVH